MLKKFVYHKPNPSGVGLCLMSLPFLALVIAFTYVPLFGWVYAFFDYRVGLSLSETKFVGLKYFFFIFSGGSEFLRVMRNTLVLSGLSILSTPFPVVFAIMLHEVKNLKFRRFVQTITTFPNFISYILVFSLFFSIFSYDGLLNHVIKLFGGTPSPIGLLGNNDKAWVVQWLISIWKTLGWNSIIYLAAIAGIDLELYDAATVDGAGKLAKIKHITIPGIYSTFMVLFLLQVSNLLNNGFDQYFVFFNALVADKIEILDYHIYKIGILANDYPQATALGMMKSVISVLLLFAANGVSKRIRGESIV